MSDSTISGLPAAATLTGAEVLPGDQAGTTVKMTAAAIAALAASAAINVNAQTGTTYTVLVGDRGDLVTFTNASAIAVTLPVATTFGAGWFFYAENRGAGTVTITPTTSTIDGAATLALTTNQGVLIASDGTNYYTSRGVGLSLGAHTWTGSQTFRAGSTAATTAPWYAQSGALMTAPEVGAFEFLTDKAYLTIGTGTARKEFTLNDAALTATRVPFATTNGRLTDVSGFSFGSSTLTVPNLIDSGLTAGRVTFAGTSGLLSDSAFLQWDNSTKQLSNSFGGAVGDIGVAKQVNGDVSIACSNYNNTAAAQSGLYAGSGGGTINYCAIQKFGNSFTTAGLKVANGGLLFNDTAQLVIATSAAQPIIFASGGTAAANERARLDASGLTMADAMNIVLNTTTGSKIGTATTQKLGFWNATPVAQKTGYGTPTNAANQGSFDATTITHANLAAHVAQLSLDLKAIGIVGA